MFGFVDACGCLDVLHLAVGPRDELLDHAAPVGDWGSSEDASRLRRDGGQTAGIVEVTATRWAADPPGIEKFREFAAHEAAHAVVAAASGVPVTRVLVVQRSGIQKPAYAHGRGWK